MNEGPGWWRRYMRTGLSHLQVAHHDIADERPMVRMACGAELFYAHLNEGTTREGAQGFRRCKVCEKVS